MSWNIISYAANIAVLFLYLYAGSSILIGIVGLVVRKERKLIALWYSIQNAIVFGIIGLCVQFTLYLDVHTVHYVILVILWITSLIYALAHLESKLIDDEVNESIACKKQARKEQIKKQRKHLESELKYYVEDGMLDSDD